MKRMARLALLACVLTWLASAPAAKARPPYPSCESLNNTACSPSGQTTPCWSIFGSQVLTCWCFTPAGGQPIWSCPVPA